MALSTVTVTVKSAATAPPYYMVHLTIAIGAGGGTYPTGGLTLPLNDPLIKASRAPLHWNIVSQAKQSGQTQYDYTFVPGATPATGVLKIFTGGAEISAATTPIGVTGDTIDAIFWFKGQE